MTEPRIFKDVGAFREWRRLQTGDVGFVPTMGALHAGHAELLTRAFRENNCSVLSIFVNPTQFNDPKDLAGYPRTWEADLAVARANGVDAILAPDSSALYPDGYRYQVRETRDSAVLDGAHRPGHFDGVLSVVLKLLNLVNPHRAYFGEKDFQQLALVRGMVDAFFLETEIVPVATVREADGLALSSRNLRLTPEERARAPLFARALREAQSATEAAELLAQEGFGVDYVEDRGGRRYGAVRLGEVRLIDNLERKDS